MPQDPYLLFIDPHPVPHAIKDYFSKFNMDIIQQGYLDPIEITGAMPNAILINSSLIKSNAQEIKKIYATYPVPLLVINDTFDEELSILMLEAGADDCITKPLCTRELHARINAISRRVSRNIKPVDQEKEIIVFNRWKIYPSSRQVFGEDNQELFLSAGEYDLLLTFVQQPHRILDREFLLQVTKNSGLNPFDRRVDIQISRLRQKIELNAKKPLLIKTIRNGGYLFTPEVTIIREG